MNVTAEQNELHILKLVKGRDPSAMRMLYDGYIGYMAAVCVRYVPDDDDRKDILQEAFIKIMTSIGSFEYRHEGSLKAWVMRITANEALKFIRKSSAHKVVEYDDKLPDVADEPDVEGIPDDAINDMLMRLPTGYRTVFNLYVFENKSHKEIAEALGIGESSSASQYLRAKAALARMIKEYRRTNLNN